MSTSVENRVVNMVFNNNNFEDGIKHTLASLARLKDALAFTGVKDGLSGIANAINGTDMSGIENALDTISQKFTAFGILGVEILERIADKAIDVGKKMISTFGSEQMTAGWKKYAEKTTAVQTILSATGDSMEVVDAQLEKLNWFTNETSYNFVDMVGNIGKFTANGIKLDTAVTAMQGISNWAALSGQNAASASRAMYNLSQAIGVGSVKLMDWRSIENANMATKEFKELVLETAAGLGKLNKQADGTYKTLSGTAVGFENFSQTLSEDWFSKEVLTDTLNLYGDFTNKLYELTEATGLQATELLGLIEDQKTGIDITGDLAKSMGISSEEAKIFADRLAELGLDEFGFKALRAAQEAKTFEDAVNSVKDAVSTGWMQTFELIFGNYDKARKLWTQFAEDLYTIFAESGDNRNELLKEWGSSKWEKLEKRVSDAGLSIEDFESKLSELLTRSGVDVDALTEKYGSLSDAIEEGEVNAWNLGTAVKLALESFLKGDQMAGAAKSAEEKIAEVQAIVDGIRRGDYGNGHERRENLAALGLEYEYYQGLAEKGHGYKVTLSDINDEMLESTGISEDQIKALRAIQDDYGALYDLSGRSGRYYFIEGLTSAMGKIVQLLTIFKTAWKNTIGGITSGTLTNIAKGFKDLVDSIVLWDDEEDEAVETGKKLYDFLTKVFEAVKKLVGVLKNAWKAIKPIFSALGDVAKEVLNLVLDLFGAIKDAGSEAFSKMDSSGSFVTVCNKIAEALKKVAGFIADIRAKSDNWNLTGILNGALDILKRIGGFLGTIWSTVKAMFTQLDFSSFGSFFGSFGQMIRGAFSSMSSDGEKGGFFSTIFDGLKQAFESVWTFIVDKWTQLWSNLGETFENFSLWDGAKWALIITFFKKAFTPDSKNGGIMTWLMDPEKPFKRIATALESLKGKSLQELLFGEKKETFTDKIGKFGDAISKLVAPFKTLAISVGVVAVSLLILSAIPYDSLDKALTAMGMGLLRLVLVITLMTKVASGKKLLAASGALLITASAVLVLAAALGAFALIAALDPSGKGLMAMGEALGAVALSIAFLAAVCKPENLLSAGAAILGVAAAMLILSAAMILLTVSLTAMIVVTTVFDNWWMGLAAFAGVVATVCLALGILGKTTNALDLIGTAAALVIFSAAILVLTVAFGVLALIVGGDGNALATGLVALAAALIVLGASAAIFSKMAGELIAAGASLLAFGAGLAVAAAAAILADVALVGLAVAVIALSAAFLIAGASVAAVTALITLAVANGIIDILSAIGEGLKQLNTLIAEGLEPLYTLFNEKGSEAIAKFGEAFGDGIAGLGEGVGEALTAIVSSIGEGIGKGISAIGDGISDVGSSLSDVGTGLTDLSTALKDMKDIPFLTVSAGMVEIAGGIKKLNKNELTVDSSELVTFTDAIVALNDAGTNFVSGAQAMLDSISKVGTTAGMNFVSGIRAGASLAYNAGYSASSQAYSGANSYTSSFWNIGYNMAVGLGNGVYSGSGYVSGACYSIVVNALNAARRAAAVHSPSRKFMEIGNYFSKGLAIGITKGGSEVNTASERMVDNAISVAKKTAQSVSAAVENELAGPVITPVLDLDTVRAEAQQLSGILGEKGTISMGASINSQLAANQNGSYQQPVVAKIDTAELSKAIANGQGSQNVDVKVNFEGSLAQLAAILQPAIVAEAKRRGTNYVTVR